VSSHLFDFKELGEGGLPPRLDLGSVHRMTKVVYELGVNVQDKGFGERSHEYVSDLLIRVPLPDNLCQRDSEQRVTLEDLRESVENGRYLGMTEDCRVTAFQGFLVFLQNANIKAMQ
jgi:hypothetical protein